MKNFEWSIYNNQPISKLCAPFSWDVGTCELNFSHKQTHLVENQAFLTSRTFFNKSRIRAQVFTSDPLLAGLCFEFRLGDISCVRKRHRCPPKREKVWTITRFSLYIFFPWKEQVFLQRTAIEKKHERRVSKQKPRTGGEIWAFHPCLKRLFVHLAADNSLLRHVPAFDGLLPGTRLGQKG